MNLALALAALALSPAGASCATPVTHFPPDKNPSGGPTYSGAVLAGDTLYVAGTNDTDPATGGPPPDPKVGAKIVLDNVRRVVEHAGFAMNDLVWVQIQASDMRYYDAFNEVYRTYFTGPLPARAFLGSGSLLNGAHFELMGIAVRSK